GRQGTTFEVTVAGQHLKDTVAVHVTGGGVTAKVLAEERPLTPKEEDELRKALAAFQEKRRQPGGVTADEVKAAEATRRRLQRFGRAPANPSIGEFVTLEVAVDAAAPPGRRELRLVTQAGLTNPVAFDVGTLPEVSEAAWESVGGPAGLAPDREARGRETRVTLPVTLNGQIPPGGMDRYRFTAAQGTPLVVVVRARELIPYIADAVPGWFQATVALYDARGRELAFSDDYRFHPDPVLFFRIPATGEYVLEVKDALFRGREDFVYRISAGELPFVTAVFPLGGRVGAETSLLASGWNLPFRTVPLDLRAAAPGVHVVPDPRVANPVPFAADTLPEVAEEEAGDDAGQAVPRPVIVNGRIDAPGDVDVFRFNAAAGERIVAEVMARRLDSPLDARLVVLDAYGKQVALNDDHEDRAAGLDTHHADAYVAFTVRTSGACRVMLEDAQHAGGPAHAYRLRIGPPRHDFELRVTPSTLNVRAGGSVPVTVHALRRDGFDGEIEVVLRDAPAGYRLTGDPIPKGADRGRFTLDAPPSVADDLFTLRVEGRARLHGRVAVREAVPADDMMQAFIYRHLVPAQQLVGAVVGRPRAPGAARFVSAVPVRIPAGGSARVEVSLPRLPPNVGNLELVLDAPPDGISLRSVRALADTTEFVLAADPARVKAGLRGTLIVNVTGERAPAAGATAAARRRVALGVLPALPFEVVRP
ncbi:MAG: hypothetical protein JNM10_05195, partial [Planctomycetia bacterium]|nr:hypothetical protein [Planctomycetia bacterium]